MPDFPDKLRLKEQAEEDIYFAKRDKERIKALRKKRLAEQPDDDDKDAKQTDRSGNHQRKTPDH